MIISLDNIPNYQDWLQLQYLKLNHSSFKSVYFAIAENTNRVEYPSTHKFLNSDRYLERVIRQDQDCLCQTYRVNYVYCLRYKLNTQIDIEVYDHASNLLAVHKIGKVTTKNNEIKLKYLVNNQLLEYGIDNNSVRKQCLQLIDDLELMIVSSKLDNTKVDDTFLTANDQTKRKCSKKTYLKNKKRAIPVKRSRSYEIDYK
jgi:hypothetical protein